MFAQDGDQFLRLPIEALLRRDFLPVDLVQPDSTARSPGFVSGSFFVSFLGSFPSSSGTLTAGCPGTSMLADLPSGTSNLAISLPFSSKSPR